MLSSGELRGGSWRPRLSSGAEKSGRRARAEAGRDGRAGWSSPGSGGPWGPRTELSGVPAWEGACPPLVDSSAGFFWVLMFWFGPSLSVDKPGREIPSLLRS